MNSELLNQLIDRAVAVLNQHIVPGGISDRDALSELYGIFDGPEYRVAIAAPPAPILAQPEPLNVWREAVLDQCALSHMPFHKDDPRKTITEVIDWYVQAATDSILSQHEPESSPVAEVIECPVMGQQTLRECGEGWKSLRYGDLLYTAPPALYRNPADDVALKRSFDAMESGIVAELRKELADMTAQRDKLLNELAVMEADRDYWQECYWCIT